MKTYKIEIIQSNNKKYLAIDCFILSEDLQKIKDKLGNIEQYPVGKKRTIKIKEN